jgi:predicted PurR-regulated permease PerM
MYTKNVMKYITVLLLAVFLIPFVPNVNAQDIMDQLTGGIQSLTGGAGQSANNTSEQAGQAGQNMSSEAGQAGQSMNSTAQQAGQNMSSGAGQAGQSMNSTAQQAGQNASSATSGNNASGGGIGDMLGNLIPGQ